MKFLETHAGNEESLTSVSSENNMNRGDLEDPVLGISS